MRILDYEDERGRWLRVELPDDATDAELQYGIPVGPPPVVDFLKLPEPFATRLHNELFARQLWNKDIVSKSSSSLLGALQAALRLDVQVLQQAFIEYDQEVAPDGAEEKRP